MSAGSSLQQQQQKNEMALQQIQGTGDKPYA